MSPHNADRNLLLGILAYQNAFITKDQLLAAMQAWLYDKSRPLADILRGQGALDEPRRALLDALVDQHVKQHGGDPQKSLQAVSSAASVRRDLEGLPDPDLQASMAYLPSPDPSEPERQRGASDDPFATVSVGAFTMPGVRFRILRPHAKGGLGEVFVAQDEELHREVALKEIQNRHADNQESHARFLLEAEITGGLEHPGIVPVYGLGQYADGRPFYAMRFIRGDSLQDAIEKFHKEPRTSVSGDSERALEFRKLLGRFIDVCQAMQYAHDRGVLHRDLKPGNIMLGKYGETLVVDWGLAKATGKQGEPGVSAPGVSDEPTLRPASASGSAETQAGTALGTPAYMSPEQAAGRLDLLGPASDVYSLGATLYCLLTGKPPIEDKDVAEVLKKVRTGDFPRPRQRKPDVDPALEAICLKAMALVHADRYASPRALADDIEHWLADEPVSARREPLRVRVGRWGRRHKPAVASAVALLLTVAVSLAVGIVLLSQKQGEVVQERNTAQRARDKAEAINKFLVDDLLASGRPEELGRNVTMREVLDRAAKKVETAFPDQPEVEAAVRLAIGDSYRSLSLHAEAEPHLRRAVILRQEVLGPEHPDTLKAINSLAWLLVFATKAAEAQDLLRENLEVSRRVLGPDAPESLMALHLSAWALLHQGKAGAAEPPCRQCLEARRRVLGPDHHDTLWTAHNLAQICRDLGKLVESEKLHRDNLETRRRVRGPEHPETLVSMNDLALAMQEQGKLADAEALFRKVAEIAHRVNGPEHRETLNSVSNLAEVLRELGKSEQAEKLLRDNLQTCRRVLGPEHYVTLRTMNNMAMVLEDRGQPQEAESLHRESLKVRTNALGPEHQDTLGSMNNLALFLAGRKPKEAEDLYRQGLEIQKRVLGPEHPQTLIFGANLANFLRQEGKLEEAEALCRLTLDARRRILGHEHPHTLNSMNDLGMLLSRADKLDEAEALYRQSLELELRVLGVEHNTTLATRANLAHLLTDKQKLDEAEKLYRQNLEIRRRVWGPEHSSAMREMNDLAVFLLNERGKPAEAEPIFRAVLENWRRTLGPDNVETVIAMENLAYSLLDQRKLDEAERLFRQILEMHRKSRGSEHSSTLGAISSLAEVLGQQGKADQEEVLRRQVFDVQKRVLGPEHATTQNALHDLAWALSDQGKLDEGERLFRELLSMRRKKLPAGHRDLAPALAGLGSVLTRKEQAKEAEPLLREALEIREKTRAKGHWQTAWAQSLLGGCLTELKRYPEAEPLLLAGYEVLSKATVPPPRREREALARVIRLYEAWGKEGKATEWREKKKPKK